MINRYGRTPCICFGPIRYGMEGMQHQPDEFIEVDRLMECILAVTLFAADWCGLVEE
jgi:acetylornithine deacetylase